MSELLRALNHFVERRVDGSPRCFRCILAKTPHPVSELGCALSLELLKLIRCTFPSGALVVVAAQHELNDHPVHISVRCPTTTPEMVVDSFPGAQQLRARYVGAQRLECIACDLHVAVHTELGLSESRREPSHGLLAVFHPVSMSSCAGKSHD